ncbi:unnamed protein product, partial [marine sediment metagenome]
LFCDPEGRMGKKFRPRSPENILKEIKILYNQYNIREICFYDDTFTVDRERIVQLCKELIKRNLDLIWECRTRVDCVDGELLKLMAQAGCYRIRFGVEAGNEKILKVLRKGITKEQARNAFRWSKKYGIETFAYFMLGSPEEDKITMKESIDFALELNVDYALFSPTLVFNKGSDLFKWAVSQGCIDPDYWNRFVRGEDLDPYPVLETPQLDRQTKLNYSRKAYRRFYLRPSFIFKKILDIKDPRKITKYSLIFFQIILRKFEG